MGHAPHIFHCMQWDMWVCCVAGSMLCTCPCPHGQTHAPGALRWPSARAPAPVRLGSVLKPRALQQPLLGLTPSYSYSLGGSGYPPLHPGRVLQPARISSGVRTAQPVGRTRVCPCLCGGAPALTRPLPPVEPAARYCGTGCLETRA